MRFFTRCFPSKLPLEKDASRKNLTYVNQNEFFKKKEGPLGWQGVEYLRQGGVI